MGVTTTQTNKPFNPRGNDQSPLAFNRAKLFSGKALSFDGVNDYLASDSFSLDTSEWSASMILKNDTAGSDQVFLTFAATGSNDESFILYNNFASSNKISFYGGAFTGSPVVFDYVIPTDYEHLTFTFASNTLSLYVNGVFVDSGSVTGNDGTQTASAIVGARKQAAYGQYFNGQVSGLKMYSTALTAAQVADLYNNPEKVVPTGVDNTALKLWLPMQEGAGTTAYDGSGNGNHGTISGATYTHGIGAPVSQTAVMNWNKGSNRIKYSEDFSELASDKWRTNNTTLTHGQTDPFGGTTATRVQISSGSNGYVYQTTTDSAGNYVVSCYIKGSTSQYISLSTGGLNRTGSKIQVTTDWVRYDYAVDSSDGANGGWQVDNYSDGTGSPSVDIYIAFAQREAGTSVGPYIPTFATAQTTPVLLPQGLTSGRDITGVNLFENVRKQGALNLDGNSWAEVHDNESVDVSAFTLEGWIYTNSITSDNRILSKWFSGYPNRTFQFSATNDDLYLYISDGSSSNNTFVLNVLSLNNWHHCVATYDGANLKIYLDGVLKVTTASTMTLKDSDQPVYIGAYVGSLDPSDNTTAQPRIYNRALTAEEVARNYNNAKSIYTNS